jgi:hypothetical protein
VALHDATLAVHAVLRDLHWRAEREVEPVLAECAGCD